MVTSKGITGTKADACNGRDPYLVRVSPRFLVLSILFSIAFAFGVGAVASVLVAKHFREKLAQVYNVHHPYEPIRSNFVSRSFSSNDIRYRKNKQQTTVSSARYIQQDNKAVVNSRWIHYHDVHDDSASESPRPTEENDEDSDISKHDFQGMHLLMDIEYVDSEFLNSEKRLSNAMLDLVQQSGLTLLSYHCHGLTPSGVSCAAVLLESHVTFHTWPNHGVITLDLFAFGNESLLPFVPIAEKLFGIPMENGAGPSPHSVWAHKLRGFEDLDDENNDETGGESEMSDFYAFPIGRMTDFKEKVLSAQTPFQRIDIYDVLVPNVQSFDDFAKSLRNDGSYQANHPELFRPDRIVFLDGVMQSRRSGDAAYHEALVHPAMFAHANPKRVAIIGGGEGATLREVLKHKTVEKVVMIDIDEQMVSLSREYLPDWSDCSMLEGSSGTGSCFDDPRVELYCEDAFAWFIDRYSEASQNPFDVIIMDLLDPQIQVPFVEALYSGGAFLNSIPNALSEDGIFVAQVGESASMVDPPEHLTLQRNRATFSRTLTRLGFQAIRDYEESRGGFFSPWQYFVAFKSWKPHSAWLDSEAVVEYKIRSRIRPILDGNSALRFFDGAQMMSYFYPSKASEVVFCRGHQELPNCLGNDRSDLEPKVPAILQDVERLNVRLFRTSEVPVKESVSLIGLSRKACYLSRKLNTPVSPIGSLGWTSQLELLSLSLSKLRRGQLPQECTLMRDVCSALHSFNRSNHPGIDVDAEREYLVSSEAVPAETVPNREFGDSGKLQIYNPAADRQAHLRISQASLGGNFAGDKASCQFS